MGLRSTLASFISAPAARMLERDLRELVEDVLASRPVAHAADVEALRARLAEMTGGASDEGSAGVDAERVAALEARVASLEKKLSMAMGAVQAGNAQLMAVKQTAEEAHAAARQAGQHATSAKATAEAAADGVTGVEERLDALVEHLGTDRRAPPAQAEAEPEAEEPAPEPEEASSEEEAADRCRVSGCTNKHRARGFCARHYQQFRRSTLEGFVGPDGVLLLDGVSLRVDEKLAGLGGARGSKGQVLVDGEPVEATPIEA